MVKDSLFQLISKMFKEGGVGLGKGPTCDDEGFLVFADFKCF